MTLKIMCNSYLCEVARMTFTTKGQSKTTSLLVLSITNKGNVAYIRPSKPTLTALGLWNIMRKSHATDFDCNFQGFIPMEVLSMMWQLLYLAQMWILAELLRRRLLKSMTHVHTCSALLAVFGMAVGVMDRRICLLPLFSLIEQLRYRHQFNLPVFA